VVSERRRGAPTETRRKDEAEMPETIEEVVSRMTRAWLDEVPEDLEAVLHPDVVMVFPGFGGRTRGAAAMLAGFEEFWTTAEVLEHEQFDLTHDVAGDTATVSYRYRMLYSRAGSRYRATGRDLWVFGRRAGEWRATWRTMLDLHEEAVDAD